MLRFFTENWQLKLMSFGFSLILWFFVMGERRMEVGYTVPLELLNVPEGLVVVSEVPNTVDVRLSGPRAMLADLDEKDIRISLNLAELKPGVSTFRRLDEHLRLPVGVRLMRTSPSSIDVKLDQIIEKELPVRPQLSGKPANGYRLLAAEVIPARVTVRGPEVEVSRLSEVVSDRIELDGVKASREVIIPLGYRGKFSRLKDVENVRVYLRIEPIDRPSPIKKPSRR